MQWHVRIENSVWSVAEYWLSWDESKGVLKYKAEGRDNPKDLWGSETDYPPHPIDDLLIEDIFQKFGLEVMQKVLELTGYKKNTV